MSDLSQFVIPRGFRFGAAKAGLKQSGRTDFALIVADAPASAAAAFTGNRVKAAPLLVDAEHLRATGGKVRVVAINAGNANCAVGQAGIDAARATCKAAAETFACMPEEVFPSSTGVIGVPLPAEKLIAALPELAKSHRLADRTTFSRSQRPSSPPTLWRRLPSRASCHHTGDRRSRRDSPASAHCRCLQGLGHDSSATRAACHDAGLHHDRCCHRARLC